MRPADLRALLRRVRRGSVTLGDAADRILESPMESLEFATLDHQRSLRLGFPEVVLAQGKTPDQVAAIARRLLRRAGVVMVTRADPAARAALLREHPGAQVHERARIVVMRRRRAARPRGS